MKDGLSAIYQRLFHLQYKTIKKILKYFKNFSKKVFKITLAGYIYTTKEDDDKTRAQI